MDLPQHRSPIPPAHFHSREDSRPHEQIGRLHKESEDSHTLDTTEENQADSGV